jgi:hypothetical protein
MIGRAMWEHLMKRWTQRAAPPFDPADDEHIRFLRSQREASRRETKRLKEMAPPATGFLGETLFPDLPAERRTNDEAATS